MFKPVRVVATVVFLLSIVLVLVGAFVIGSNVLCLSKHFYHATRPGPLTCASNPVFVFIEYLAFTWYTLSYIPYARTAVLKVFGM